MKLQFTSILSALGMSLSLWSCAHSTPEALVIARQQMKQAETLDAPNLAPREYLDALKSLETAEHTVHKDDYDDIIEHDTLLARTKTGVALYATQQKVNEKRMEDFAWKQMEIKRLKEHAEYLLQWQHDVLMGKEREIGRKEETIDSLDKRLNETQKKIAELEKEREQLYDNVIGIPIFPYGAEPRK